jgi:hemerythrin-like domain-containing protein
LEALRYQHERGRNLIAAIAGHLGGYEAGDHVAAAALLEEVAAYTSLLRHHIHTEDHVFYPMARQELGTEDMAQLLDEFESDRIRTGERTFEHSHKLVVDMASMLSHM